MLKIKKLFVLFVSAIILSFSFASFANQDTPLIIIRFNQDFVKYEKSLHKSVSAALQVKPSTFFDIVSLVPHANKSGKDKEARKTSEALTAKIVQNIKGSGVSEDKIRVTYQDNPGVQSPEIHIFAR